VHGFFHRILLFHFLEVSPYGVMDLCCFRHGTSTNLSFSLAGRLKVVYTSSRWTKHNNTI
jgi:hypothetical protein